MSAGAGKEILFLFCCLPLFTINHYSINPYFQVVNLIDNNGYKDIYETRGAFARVSGVSYSVIREMNFGIREDFDSGSWRCFDGIFHDQFSF